MTPFSWISMGRIGIDCDGTFAERVITWPQTYCELDLSTVHGGNTHMTNSIRTQSPPLWFLKNWLITPPDGYRQISGSSASVKRPCYDPGSCIRASKICRVFSFLTPFHQGRVFLPVELLDGGYKRTRWDFCVLIGYRLVVLGAKRWTQVSSRLRMKA